MIVRRLGINNLRAFRGVNPKIDLLPFGAEFEFQPGMNLLVGINGVGKSTALDAIRILLSQMMPKISNSTSKPIKFTDDDISIGRDFVSVELVCRFGERKFSYSIQNYHSNYKPVTKQQKLQVKLSSGGRWLFHSLKVRSENLDQAISEEFLKIRSQQPLAIFFSPHRSIVNIDKKLKNNLFPAYTEALELRRQFNLQELITWWLGYDTLAKEDPFLRNILDRLNKAVCQFLDNCSNLRAVKEPKEALIIEKAGNTLNVQQLSDGERGVLALVLDLTKRLAQANPYLENPAKDGKAVVLIDELDLHLHPKWQRTIVHQLTRTFPNCQFIATTHSPQIISEVQPEGLTFLIREGDQVVVKPATQAYGLDTNWILDHLMDVPSRPELAQDLINQIENSLEEGQLDKAREEVQKLRKMLHGDDGEVVRLETSIYNLEALADEMDTEEH